MTIEHAIEGMKSGKRYIVTRRDHQLLPELLRLAEQGLVTSELVQPDEQSSFMEFKWNGTSANNSTL